MMQPYRDKPFHAQGWFYAFLLLHLFAWVLTPILVRYNLPLDAIEGTIWGHQLEWGYDKNPYLNGWLTALAVYLGGASGWAIYLCSQLSVIACFWAVWQLGKKMLHPTAALVAVLLLEGIQYYNLHAIDFNDNTLELGLWGLATYYFYLAISTSKRPFLHWLLTGIFTGLGMMAKYYTATLIACMLLLLLWEPHYRKQLTRLPPYLGLFAFLAITVPHVVWLFGHDFTTVTYVFARANNVAHWSNHFFFPAQFAWQQFEALLPALIIFTLLALSKPRLKLPTLKMRLDTDSIFLVMVGLGPLLLTLLLALIFGITLRAGWGMPLLSLSGIMLMKWLPPILTPRKLQQFIAVIFILIVTLVTGYSVALIRSDSPSSANFPGKEIANTLTQLWHDQFHQPLTYIAGSRWVGGNISFYSSDHPSVFVEWNPKHAPWINVNDLKKHGAVFIWDITNNEKPPANIRQTYPTLKPDQVIEFNWQRNNHHLPPIKIGVAILPPYNERNSSIMRSQTLS